VFLNRAQVPPRKGSRKVEAIGIFPGATVIRGPDWQWGNQDGELINVLIGPALLPLTS